MSQFRPKKLDIGCHLNIKVIRDHAKRKAFAHYEPERSAQQLLSPPYRWIADNPPTIPHTLAPTPRLETAY